MPQADTQLESRFSAGQVLGGKYRVARLIQRGGMGTVLLAHHEELDQRVAIKVLGNDFTQNPEIVARFTREARAAAKLESEHVVRVTDVGTFEGIGPYLVMEYLSGMNLEQVLQQRGPLPSAEAVDYVLEAVDALAEAHSLGIIHRDIKPSNLFVAERADGSRLLKVLDFGVSKMDAMRGEALEQSLTSARSVLGSPSYMSPEQLRSSKDVDVRTDIWSLGVVLHELLTGTLPFEAGSLLSLMKMITEGTPKPVRSLRPDVPQGLEAALNKCLQREPAQRFVNVADFALAIAPFGSGRARKEVERAASLIRRRLPSVSPPRPSPWLDRTERMMGSAVATNTSSPSMPRVSSPGMPGLSSGSLPHLSSPGMPGVSSGSLPHVDVTPLPGRWGPPPPSSRMGHNTKVLVVAVAAFITPLAIGAILFALMRTSKPSPPPAPAPSHMIAPTRHP
jgi:eukaryotic-like serine/threonine-protein kinase